MRGSDELQVRISGGRLLYLSSWSLLKLALKLALLDGRFLPIGYRLLSTIYEAEFLNLN